MFTAPSVSFRNVPKSASLEAEILERVKKLERYYGRITSCRVTLSAPRRKHRGGIFHLRIDLAVPGEEILVNHEADLDEAHADIHVALRDAFKAARRRLQDHVRRNREFAAAPRPAASRAKAPPRPRSNASHRRGG
jgi:ribosome-associated translation inhibitor RaiA